MIRTLFSFQATSISSQRLLSHRLPLNGCNGCTCAMLRQERKTQRQAQRLNTRALSLVAQYQIVRPKRCEASLENLGLLWLWFVGLRLVVQKIQRTRVLALMPLEPLVLAVAPKPKSSRISSMTRLLCKVSSSTLSLNSCLTLRLPLKLP